MDQIIDSLSLYAIENGLITCVVTIISLICWLTMPRNLVFLGLHFIISKLYANSLLATLNARKRIRGLSTGPGENHHLPVLFPSSRRAPTSEQTDTKLQINVERTVQFDVEQARIKAATEDSRRDSDELTASDKQMAEHSPTISQMDIDEVNRSRSFMGPMGNCKL